ncbi:MAG: response regulator [Synechococcales bacterium]|nr:response regulator [Synechococcales bacterium]
MITKRILIIDDEADIQAVAQLGLELEAGWQVFTAASGLDGIDQAKRHRPDAILLDIMMPNMDGLTTLKQLKATPQVCDIPVIFLTAKSQAADRRQFYAAGVVGVISKPFDPITLASQIAGFLAWN